MPFEDRLAVVAKYVPRMLGNEFLLYVGLASLAWWMFYRVFRMRTARRKIVPKSATAAQMRREFLYSLRSVCVFATVGGFVVFSVVSGWTRLYLRFEDHGLVWFFTSIALLAIAHDTWFYWTHRMMHHPLLFRRIHRLHHQSINTTPWATYSFSVPEAIIQAMSMPMMIFLIPLHPLALAVFAIWRHVFSVMGHAGYEIFPAGFFRLGFGRVLNTPTHHAQHHSTFRSNFGLYFNIWDRLMGTNHPEYEAAFAKVTSHGIAIPAAPDTGLLPAALELDASLISKEPC